MHLFVRVFGRGCRYTYRAATSFAIRCFCSFASIGHYSIALLERALYAQRSGECQIRFHPVA